MNATATMEPQHAVLIAPAITTAPPEAAPAVAVPDITPTAWKWIKVTLFLAGLYLATTGGYLAWGFFRFQNCKPGF